MYDTKVRKDPISYPPCLEYDLSTYLINHVVGTVWSRHVWNHLLGTPGILRHYLYLSIRYVYAHQPQYAYQVLYRQSPVV